jgi:hypothetical protein
MEKAVDMNKGFEPGEIASYRARIEAGGKAYVLDEDDDNGEEYTHFYFIGKYEGREVIYDAVMYTLRLQHESELFEIAEHRAAQHFPHYKKIAYKEDENGNLETLDPLEEEIGLYMAEIIMELEDDEAVKVKEHVDLDANSEFGVALDIGLHVDEIAPKTIEKFIRDFNEDTLQLDDTFFSFQTQEDEV